jgi:hypothetical protein
MSNALPAQPLTTAQTFTINRMIDEHGRVYGYSVRDTGEADVTFIDGHGFVVSTRGAARAA